MSNETSGTKSPPSACPAALLAARRGGSAPDRYVVPSEVERAGFEALVSALLGPSPDLSTAADQAQQLGYRLEAVPEIANGLLLRELPQQRRGGGAYLVRRGSASHVVVQAPHTFFDEGTLPLACELFQRAGAAALFIDTAHRYKAAEVDDHGDFPADVAHASDSLFQAATSAASHRIVPLTVVQLHGFGPRESSAALVLSSGTSSTSAPLPTRVREQLLSVVPGPIARFPDESPELGATSNVQGKIVRAQGGQFLHLEMSAGFRRTLLADDNLRARYLDALARSLELP